MARMSSTRKRGWFITILVLLGTVILAINHQDKVKEMASKVPFLANLLK